MAFNFKKVFSLLTTLIINSSVFFIHYLNELEKTQTTDKLIMFLYLKIKLFSLIILLKRSD